MKYKIRLTTIKSNITKQVFAWSCAVADVFLDSILSLQQTRAVMPLRGLVRG